MYETVSLRLFADANKRPIKGVMHSFHSGLIKGAAILDEHSGDVEGLAIVKSEI